MAFTFQQQFVIDNYLKPRFKPGGLILISADATSIFAVAYTRDEAEARFWEGRIETDQDNAELAKGPFKKLEIHTLGADLAVQRWILEHPKFEIIHENEVWKGKLRDYLSKEKL